MGPALQVPIDGIFIGDIFGFILALPVALFLAFWMSAVKSRWIVVLGALIGAVIGFVFILGWVGTLIYDTPLPNASPPAVFFGSLEALADGMFARGAACDQSPADGFGRLSARQRALHH